MTINKRIMKDRIIKNKIVKGKVRKDKVMRTRIMESRQDQKKRFLENYLQRLYPGQNANKLYLQHQKKKRQTVILIVAAGFLLGIVLFFLDYTDREIDETGQITRNEYGYSAKHIHAFVESSDYEEFELELSIPSRKYTEVEVQEGFLEAKAWLIDELKGENSSLQHVQNDLSFPARYAPMQMDITYTSSDYKRIDGQGQVYNEDLELPQTVVITAKFSYDEWEEAKDYEVTVYPPELSLQEQFIKKLKDQIQRTDNEQQDKEVLKLPKELDGIKISYKNKINNRFIYVFFLGIGCAFFLSFGMDDDLKKKHEKRQQQLLFDYPEFVSQLALLIGAGMSLTGAVRRIYMDHQASLAPLYEEIKIFIHNLDNGFLEERAIEDLGNRTGLAQYRKLCSLLAVNLKKGSMNMKVMLEQEAEDAFEQHQALIRKMGEEAGTKLLLPMAMMLVVVIAVIMIPAFLTYQIS